MLTANHLIEIQTELERNRAGLRKLPGTELKNLDTGEVDPSGERDASGDGGLPESDPW